MPRLTPIMPIKKIEALAPGRFAVAPSLYAFVSPTGGRSWVFRYTGAKGKVVDLGIGSARELSRDDAMAKVAELQSQRKAGIDPLAARRDAALSERLSASVPTFREAARAYHAANAGTWSKSHSRSWLAEMDRAVMPAIGDVRVDKITVADVLRALAGWTERHETSSRNRGRIEKVLDAQKVLGARKGENPAAWRGHLENLLPAPKAIKRAKGEQHHAAMPWEDVPAFVAGLPDTHAGRALRFLTLTAARSGEVRDAVWSEFDLEAGIWTIPASRMKAGREHVVALSGAALAILRGIERQGDFPFAIGRDDMRLLMPDGATTHGQRASFSSWAGEMGIARDVVEKCLAHLTGSAVERAYRRGSEIEQKRAVMQRWATFLAEGDKQGVVLLDARRA